jgi:hypothetical protein
VTSTVSEGAKRVASRETIAAAAVHLTSDDAADIHTGALHIDGGPVDPADRRVLSHSTTALLWRHHIGRIVGSVIAASRNALLATISVRRRSWKTLNSPGA